MSNMRRPGRNPGLSVCRQVFCFETRVSARLAGITPHGLRYNPQQPAPYRKGGRTPSRCFSSSQTEGKELPAIRKTSGDVGGNRERLFAFVERQGIELFYAEDIAPALGMSYGARSRYCPTSPKPKSSARWS